MSDPTPVDPNQLEDQQAHAAVAIEEGRRLLDAGDVEAAIASFDRATSLDEANGAAWNDLAVALFQKGESDMAIGCLYTALRADPTFADAAINLATLLQGKNRAADGIPGLRGVLFHDAEHEDVREVLEGLGVTKPRPIALVAGHPERDTTRVINACLTEWNYLVVRPDPAVIQAFGPVNDSATWARWMAAIRPTTIIIDPEHPAALDLTRACEALDATPNLLGVDLPSEGPLVDLAHAMTENLPEARKNWEDVDRPDPIVSVVAQVTHLAHTINLLDRLAAQDLAPGLFEVVIVDRAYGTPATSLFESSEYGFATNIIRMEGTGLATACQAAVEASQGRWVVFFDEESRPSTTCLSQHLMAQASATTAQAVLGDFRMHPNLIDNSLRKLIDTTGILYGQPDLIDGTVHGGAAFRANNISVPREDIQAVGGFDPRFSAGCGDTDLGIRLEQERGVTVRYDASIACEMDYPITIGDLQVEQLVRGWACVHLAEKHNDPRFLIDPEVDNLDASWYADKRLQADRSAGQASDLAARIQQVCTLEEPYRKTGAAEHFDPIVRVVGMQAFNRGIAIARSGFRLEDERMQGSMSAAPTPVVVRPGGDITQTLTTLAATDGALIAYVQGEVTPMDGVVIRQGGLDEAMATNAAAIAVVDAGTSLPPHWLSNMLGELEQWPDFGAIQPNNPHTGSGNRPAPSSTLVIARDAIDRLGETAATAIDSPRFAELLGATGYRVVTSEAVSLTANTTDTTPLVQAS